MTRRTPSRGEFVALMGMLTATIALSVDTMLPGLGAIADELSPSDANKAQLIITSFVLGMGMGTFFMGPLADRFGRKPVLLAGAGLYVIACIWAYLAQSLESVLVARVAQGIGASGPRVIVTTLVRDLYKGRDMAKITSLVMIVFTLMPAVAPSLGAVIINLAGWREIFLAFVVFAFMSSAWFMARMPETLLPENQRSLRFRRLKEALSEIFSNPMIRLCVMVQALCYTVLFAMISSAHQVFADVFDREASFPAWFALVALLAGSASILNASLVQRLGMLTLIKATLNVLIVITAAVLISTFAGLSVQTSFYIFLIWMTSIFFQAGMTLGNLVALSMGPLGHIAGTASSAITAVATITSVVLAVPIGLAFNGTLIPLLLGILGSIIVARVLMGRVDAGFDKA
ncbi:MFS transporter [Algirhabdus cladophorae]|uniref:MFS transporter n=1 Tax=Algirhabdus cladophorae TaxID=3377108 RepID=UPI003B845B70